MRTTLAKSGVFLSVLCIFFASAQPAHARAKKADIELSTHFPPVFTIGQEDTVGLQIQNNGPQKAKRQRLTIRIPKRWELKSSDGNCRFIPRLRRIMCKSSALQPGETREINLVLKPKDNAKCDRTVKFSGRVRSYARDPNRRNNKFRESVQVLCTPPVADPLTIDINGPASQDYVPGDNNAVFASVEFSALKDIEIRDMYVLLEGSQANGSPLPDSVSDSVEDIELRNIFTGQTINAAPVPSAGTPQGTELYVFKDFITRPTEDTWEILGDFLENGDGSHPKNGDKFRVYICTSAASSSDGCNFGGLYTPSPQTLYNLSASELVSGSPVSDIRPGGVVSGNYQRIVRPSLTVAVKALNPTDTAVENQKDIQLLRFEARAGEAKDILLTEAVFKASQGDAANVQNYALWVDTDANGTIDTILEDGVSTENDGTVRFADLAGGGYAIPIENTVVFELHGDVVSSLISDSLQLAFATDESEYIEAEQLDNGSGLTGISTDGSCATVSCQTTVFTTDSTLWGFVPQGNLYVGTDTTPIRNRQVLGGALSETILGIDMRAETEDIDVRSININSAGINRSIDRLSLFKKGESAAFAFATRGNCIVDNPFGTRFCARMENQQLIVPEGDNVDVYVRAQMKADTQGAFSGDEFHLFVEEFKARGAVSAGDLTNDNENGNTNEGEIIQTTDNIEGPVATSVLSKIVSITNANPDPNGKSVPVGISDFGQFTFSVAPHQNNNNGNNDVVLDGLIFNVTATNVDLHTGSYMLFNKSDATATANCAAVDIPGGYNVVCDNLQASTVDTEIDQGDDITLVLRADIVNPQVDFSLGSVLQASLQNFDSRDRTIFGTSPGDSHLRWFDKDGGSSTEFLWVEYPETTVKSTTYQN